MSEKSESSASEGIDPFAASLALSGASREKADGFLDDQRHHLHEQLKQIHLDIFEKWLGVFLRLATLCVGLAAATGVGLMVWDAAHSEGLLIEPFTVPPDLAAKGITGQTVASQLLDKLTVMQHATQSFRPARSYANNWGNDIKVEIPETGVSIGEFRRFLREWLGHDTHITGEVWHTDSGLAISARATGGAGAVITGVSSDFDGLVQKAAEHIYEDTQPYRYANDIRAKNPDQAQAIHLRLTESSSALERGWAWYGVGNVFSVYRGNNRAAIWAFRKAIAAYPDITLIHTGMAAAEKNLGHDEAALAERQIVQRLLNRDSFPDVDPAFLDTAKAAWAWPLPFSLGDYSQTLSIARPGVELPDQSAQRAAMRAAMALSLARQHDGAGARNSMQDLPPAMKAGQGYLTLRFQVEAALENLQNTIAAAAAAEKGVKGDNRDHTDLLATVVRPWLALAKAKLGDLKGAEALIATTPGDCYDCVRIRGQIAQAARQPGRADYWFARAVHDGPSLPFAYTDWGQALLERGEPDAAITQFTIANRKSPHFADPLEAWGEALMVQNQSHLALAKFAEAEKYAPNWDRLHLKWGEALVYAGKRDEAKAQFARATQLDLTPSEKAELAKVRHV